MRSLSHLPVWVKAVRLLGACIGLFFVLWTLSGGLPSAPIRLSYRDYVPYLHILIGVILVLRWSFLRLASSFIIILFAFVTCLILLLPHYAFAFTQTLDNPNFPSTAKIVFSVLEVVLVLILFAQIPSLWVIRKHSSQLYVSATPLR